MPQDNQTPQIAGSDVLLDTLRRSRITDDQRQQIWNAYHVQGDEKAFVQSMRGLPVNDDMRQDLYNMRYKGWKNEGNQPSNASTVTNLDTQAPAKGDVRPSTPNLLQSATSIGPRPTTIGNRISAVVAPFMEHLRVGGAAQDSRLLAPEAAMTPTEQTQHPMLRAAGEVAGSFTSGSNIALIAGSAGLGEAAPALSKMMNFAFSAQMLKGAYEQYAPLRQAWNAGDEEGVKYHLAHMLLNGAFGLHGVTEGMSTDPKSRLKVKEQIEAEAKGKETDPQLNARIRQAATLVDKATSLGPISANGGQQLQLDFATKAPVEAQAPQALTVGATKSATVDRGSLIGQEAPVGLYRFPKEAIEGMPKGGTIGLDKIDLSKPATRTPEGGLKLSTDTLGVKWAENSEGVRVSVPSRIPAEQIQEFASQKITEQAKMQEGIKARQEPLKYEPVASPPPAVDSVPKLFQTIGAHYDHLADLSRQADLAENDDHADNLNRQRQQIEQISNDRLKTGLQNLAPQEVVSFRDEALKRAEQLEAQSKAIRDLTEATVKNRGIKRDIADLRSEGGPVRQVVNPETGERSIMKPEERAGRGGRSVLDELQGRVPISEFDSMQVAGKPEGVPDEEWAQHVTKLQVERQSLKRKITDSVTIASETGASLSDMGLDEHVDRLKQIEGLLGKYVEPAETGRRPNIAPVLDENGAIKFDHILLPSWTRKMLERVFGENTKLRVKDDEELFQHADMRQEKGRLLRNASDIADREIISRKKAGQAGAVGGDPLRGKVQGQVKPVSLADSVPEDKEIMKRAAAAKIYARELNDQMEMGIVGFLSKDGKIGIDNGFMSHDDVAESVLPELGKGKALKAMLEKGWIRKASPVDYEAITLDSKTLATIEKDLLQKGRYGQRMALDTRRADGRFLPLYLEDGWGDTYKGLEEAVAAARRRQGVDSEAGVSGPGRLGLATGGAITGAVVGAHLGGPIGGVIGGAIGWGAGFVSPAIANHPLFWSKLNALKPGITGFNISLKDWLKGPLQEPSVLGSEMAAIRDAQQRDIKGPSRSFLSRVSQLPGDTYVKLFDKFGFINDRPGALANLIMKFDPRGAAFRDLRGKLSVDNSPYVSAWLAAGGGGGMAEAHLIDYKGIYKDAQSSKTLEHLTDYLNLKGYQRVYDVAQERINEYDQSIQHLKLGLQQAKLPVEVEAGMKKALRQAISERQDVIDKLVSKTMVPAPYDPTKIATDLKTQEQVLGPQKFAQVKAQADRVFALNRKVLDMVHDAGIVGDAEYQKYTGRGDEYIPMHRILEQVSEVNQRLSQNPQDSSARLYLKQQNVIKALMGSERINRDPVISSADANLEAIKEVMRNGVIEDYLRIAQADPQGVGSYFKPVRSGYKAGPDEGLIGAYENGQSQTYAVPSWLAESLKNVSPTSADIIGKGPMQYFGQILRKGATMGNLAWSVPNALRHLGDMALMSEAGLKDIKTLPRDVVGMIKEWNKSLYSTIVSDGARQEYLRSGAAFSTLQSMISPEEHLDPTTLGFKSKVAHGRIIDVVSDFNKAVEDATKMTTFKRLRQAGYTEKAAAWETRRYGGGPDFARQGTMTPAIGLVSMFFNAHLQYVTRAFARAAENPMRTAVTLGALTAMGMALSEHNYNQKDEKGNLLIRKVPFTDRENNFVVLTGDTYTSSSGATLPVYYKIPKPSFVKFLYNPIENTLNKIDGHEERSGTQLGLQAIGNLSPGQMDLQQGEVGKSAVRGAVSSLNPVIRAPLEEAMNYKTTGFGAPIVPGREQGIDPRYQLGPNTSETAKRIGEGGVRGAVAGGAEGLTMGYLLAGPKGAAAGGALGSIAGSFGISPRRAEHVIDTTTAGVAKIATGFVDPFLGGVKQTRMEGPEKLASTPIAGPILGRFISISIDQQEQTQQNNFYRNVQEAQVPLNTLKFLEKNHPEQIPAYLQTHKKELWAGQVATTMSQRFGQIQNAEKMIQQNTSMPEKDRSEALKNLHAVKLQVLDTFNKVLKPSPQVGQATTQPGAGQGNAR